MWWGWLALGGWLIESSSVRFELEFKQNIQGSSSTGIQPNFNFSRSFSNSISWNLTRARFDIFHEINLNIYFNCINLNHAGHIPKEIGRLANLVELQLEVNHLNGSIPKEIGNITAMHYLWIHDNELSGTIYSLRSD